MRALIAVLVGAVLIAVGLPLGAVYVPYLYAWAVCGHRPVSFSGFLGADVYYLPGDPGGGPMLLNGYGCTEADVPVSFRRAATGQPRPYFPPSPTPTPAPPSNRDPCFSGSGRCN
jgi:hypothetical protein